MRAITVWLTSSQEFFQHLGWLGVLAYAVCMAIAGLFSSPLSPFAITAGMFFGFGRGFIAVQLGTMLSSAVNFLVARYIARDFVYRRLAAFPKFQAIDAAVGREGWKIVALIRFIPMPFGLANYAFGLTAVRFWPYVFATAFPIIIGNCFFVWVGVTTQAGIAATTGAGHQRHPMEWVMMGLAGVATLVAMVFVTRVAKKAVAQRDQSLVAE